MSASKKTSDCKKLVDGENAEKIDASEMKKNLGRPTKYQDHYPRVLIDIMTDGDDVVHFCVAVGIAKETFYRWTRDHEEFQDAYKIARTACEAWWINIGRKGMIYSKEFNAKIFSINMGNRFEWRDRKATYKQVEMPGFVGSLADKAAALDAELNVGNITAGHHAILMSSLYQHSQILKVDEYEKRLDALEEAGKTINRIVNESA